MNSIQTLPAVTLTDVTSALRQACLASGRKVLEQIDQTRRAILDQFSRAFAVQQGRLHLALNEAEALAWQSGVPQLVFPTLALEKAEAVVAWHERQRAIQRATGIDASTD